MLESYISNAGPRPPGIVANPAADLTIIRDAAEQKVRDREAYHLRSIGHEATASLKHVIARDRQGQTAAPADRQHDSGHEQEH